MFSDRRVHPRAVVRLRGRLRTRGATDAQEALILDLSAGGAGVHVPAALEVGSEVTLEFELSAGKERDACRIEVLCLVVRSGRPARSDPLRPHLAGLHFLSLDPESAERIRAYVWERLPKTEE